MLSTALPLFLLLGYQIAHEAKMDVDNARQTVKSLALVTATDTAAALSETERIARTLSERPLVRALDPAHCDPFLNEFRNLNHHYANIATVDMHGNSPCSLLRSGSEPVNNIGNPDWLVRLKATNRFSVGSPQRGIYTGRWIIVTAYPIRDAQGAVAGAVIVGIELAAFRPVVSVALPAGSVAGIIDADGVVIARSEPADDTIGSIVSNAAVGRAILEGRIDTEVRVGKDGTELLHAYRPIPGTRWFASVGIPVAMVYTGANTNTWRNLVIGLLILGVAGLSVAIIHRRIAGPLSELDKSVKAIADNPEGPPARETGPVEIRSLAASFNRMLASLAAARDAQHISEERLRQAANAAGLGLYDRDFETNTGTWDARTRQIWELGADEPIRPDSFMAGLHPDDRAAMQNVIDAATKPGSDGTIKARFRVTGRSSGIVRHVETAGQVLFREGRAVRAIGFVRDVSADETLQTELRQRRTEMERLVNQQVAVHTAAAIAHELNQPLHAVSMYSQAALDMLKHGNPAPEKTLRALELGADQARRAGNSLHELIEYLHRGEPVTAPFDLNQAIQEALVANRDEGHTGYRCVLRLTDGLPPVLGDRLQIVKVLHNLINNGVEAMQAAGIPAGELIISVGTSAAGDMAQVAVRDSGPGLSEELANRVFEPFFTTKTKGMGLGLSISRALVQAHGGQLWCQPVADPPGAEFHFTLPFAP